jgi:hypothetical protein
VPLQTCRQDGKPGFKWGNAGACYTYDPGDDAAKGKAKQQAIKQGVAIEGGSDKLPKDPSKVMADGSKVCAGCGKSKARRAFPPDGRTADSLAATCAECRFGKAMTQDDVRLAVGLDPLAPLTARHYEQALDDLPDDGDLPTVDISAVEAISAGGPYYGQGSPEGGDFFTDEEIAEMAENTAILIKAGELRPPNKIGHSNSQKLLANSGLQTPGDGTKVTSDEEPAAGWLDNVRADGGKLVTDVKKVPRKLGLLIRAGAFRTRSVEMSRVKPQSDEGKARAKELGSDRLTVISALAWLGAKAPAVRTLDDAISLYADGDHESAAALLTADESPTDDTIETRDYATGDVVWKPGDGLQARLDRIRSALNPGPNPSQYYVRDATDALALVESYNEPCSTCWIVPYEIDAEGDVRVAPSSEWTLAQQAWVEAASSYADRNRSSEHVNIPRPPADTSVVSVKTKFSDEQIAKLAEGLGIDEADEAKRREAVEAQLEANFSTPPAGGESGTDGGDAGTGGTGTGTEGGDGGTEPEPGSGENKAFAARLTELETKLEVAEAKAERGDRAYAESLKRDRDLDLKQAIHDGRIEPSAVGKWEKRYEDLGAEMARTLLSELPINEDFKRTYGSDDDSLDPEIREAGEDVLYRQLAEGLGIPNAPSLRKEVAS